ALDLLSDNELNTGSGRRIDRNFESCVLISAISPFRLVAMRMTMAGYPIARDREEFAARSNKGEWSISWDLTSAIPEGTAYGANAFCVTAENHVVLISEDGERWGRPGGRPEGDESWEQTVRREVSEEACAVVVDARLLGFTRSACLTGPEQGLVLVRSIWLAEVEVSPWAPRLE